MYPESILDLLNRASYWNKVVTHNDADYDKYVAALAALVSYGAYGDDAGELLQSLIAQRFRLPSDCIAVAPLRVSAPALFVDTNVFIIRIPVKPEEPALGNIVLIAFRGTEFAGKNFLADVFTDARAVPVAFPSVTATATATVAPRGLLVGAASRLADDLLETLARFNFPVPNLLATEKSWVHGGFLTAADFVWAKIVDAIAPETRSKRQRTAQESGNGGAKSIPDSSQAGVAYEALASLGDDDRLYITGHSLGAAVAVLAAARLLNPPEHLTERLLNIKRQLRGVYTYGQPMIGGERFKAIAQAQPIGQRTFRHVYHDDWVPHLPPLSTGLYAHFGREWRARNGARFVESTNRTGQAITAIGSGFIALLPFIFKAVQILNRASFAYSLEDHQPENYLRSCEAALEQPSGAVRPETLIRSSKVEPATRPVSLNSPG